MAKVLDVSQEGTIATISINRPEALNAINSDVISSLKQVVSELDSNKCRAIILTGEGKAFVAGADIAEMKDYGPEEAEAFSIRGQEAFSSLRHFPGPVIAAINGFALGGGLELALACDILIASDQAKLGLPEATLGVVPGFGGTQTLPRRVGPGQAKRLMMTGEIIEAAEAAKIGLVDLVVDSADLITAATNLASKVVTNGPIAVREAKRLIDEGAHMKLDEAVKLEAIAFGEIFGTTDQEEGMGAFLEKRKADFTGS